MSGIVDVERLEEPRAVVEDYTIGVAYDTDETVEIDGRYDVTRLRRALLEYDEAVGDDVVALSIAETPDGRPRLVLQEPDGTRSVVLAGREVLEDGGRDE